MNPYLEVSGVAPAELGALLGISPELVLEWANGQAPMPWSMASHLGAVLGVPEERLLLPPKQPVEVSQITPAVWFKFRGSELSAADREVVFLARRLGVLQHELERVSAEPEVRWTAYFSQIQAQTSMNATPHDQARKAAQLFRSFADLNKGKSGVGELVRPGLRRLGILVIESPISKSRIEGCTFMVGPTAAQRPCIFINSYKTNWFRRNELLMHELCHAIFDLGSSGAALDYNGEVGDLHEVSETRANAFAQEALVPKEVLHHLANQHGIAWDKLETEELAILIAETHVEKRLVLKAAVTAGFLSPSDSTELEGVDLWSRVKELTEHALSASEYLTRIPEEARSQWRGKRNTTLPSRRLRLPITYIKAVVEAQAERLISIGRAAHLLMITAEEYVQRFQPHSADEAEWA